MNFNYKKVLLVGAGGKTGEWYARLLLSDGFEVYLFDAKGDSVLKDDIKKNKASFIVSASDYESGNIIDFVDCVTLSPGVSLKQPIFQEAALKNKFIFSELEYCFERLNWLRWIAVTGTDGKSTTTALIDHLLNQNGASSIAAGNYGLPFSRILFEKNRYQKYNYIVAELSSYQLELSRNFSPEIGIYLNLAPDHLDRYKSVEEYGLVKWNLMRKMYEGSVLIINTFLLPDHSPFWKKDHPLLFLNSQIDIVPVDCKNLSSERFNWNSEGLLSRKTGEALLKKKDLLIAGNHNYCNALFAIEAVTHALAGISEDVLVRALQTFKSLEHRFETVASHQNITYINDSKATTIQAALTAIQNVQDPFYLFMGGRSKGEDYGELTRLLSGRDVHLFLYGENRNEISGKLSKELKNINLYESLSEAVSQAFFLQESSENKPLFWLLAPASTLWDQFSSFEERGEHFKKLIHEHLKITGVK